MNRAQLDKKPREVAAMFDDVAKRYDLTNEILSAGQASRWRTIVTEAVAPRPGQRILDLAAGTGTSSVPFVRAGAEVIAGDISSGMLEEGRRRHPEIDFRYADACELPFEDGSFDTVTISFGLRNVPTPETALAEMARVTKPGGRLVVCEFSTPVNPAFRTAYMEYLMKALPRLARVVSSNPDAYVYLAESIRAWPDQEALSHQILDAGWGSVSYRNLNGGIVALHRAFR